MGILEPALELARCGDWCAATAELVRVWHSTHSPHHAELIRGAAKKVPDDSLPEGSGELAHQEWLAVASGANPLDTLRLIAALRTANDRQATERLRSLGEAFHTPLISGEVIELLREPPWREKRQLGTWTEVFRALNAVADVSVLEELRTLEAGYAAILPDRAGEHIARRIGHAAKQLEPLAHVPPAADAESRQLAALIGSLSFTSNRRDEAELLASIYSDPESDERRAVYADLLDARGDSRGKFINLQLARAAGSSTAHSCASEQELLTETNLHRWSGGIASVAEKVFYRRGFIDYVELNTTRPRFKQVANHVAWSTVESIAVPRHGTYGSFGPIAKLLSNRRTRGLRNFLGAQAVDIAQLPTSTLARLSGMFFEMGPTLELREAVVRWLSAAAGRRHLAIGFTGLRSDSFPVDEMSKLARTPEFEAVSELSIEIAQKALEDSLSEWIAAVLTTSVETLRFHVRGSRLLLVLERGRGAAFTQVRVRARRLSANGASASIYRLLAHIDSCVLTLDARVVNLAGHGDTRARTKVIPSATDVDALADELEADYVLSGATAPEPLTYL